MFARSTCECDISAGKKLQVIQEYRFLLYAILVILILLYRPDGLLPRRLREYFPRRQRE